MRGGEGRSFVLRALRGAWIASGALALTAILFLVLPWMQTIAEAPETDLVVRAVESADVPPPPPPPEEEPEEEPEPEEPPPELVEELPPLDLSQLELALSLDAGSGAGDWGPGEAALALAAPSVEQGEVEELFSMSDLDQKPRVLHQPSPAIDEGLRKRTPSTVHVIFVVDQQGRVEDPAVQSSTDPAFERPALAAVKQWKFEPGKRKGEPVRFRMRVPITFSRGS